ncbi:MAG: large subunit ribosomal protein L29, partial [Candidatus Krumholzibacteriia bacterium]
MKKASELRDLPLDELQSLLTEKSEELMTMKIQLNMRQMDNPLQVRYARREIAVINTVITEKR